MNIGTYVRSGVIGTFGDEPAPVEVVPDAVEVEVVADDELVSA